MKKLNICLCVGVLLMICSCSNYKSSWSCESAQGIGCTSIEYADIIARKEIVLNERVENTKDQKVLILEHYADFKRQPSVEVDLE